MDARQSPAPRDPARLLLIHFGQLGDVILGLPALDAIRARFPDAEITALTGTPADEIVRLAALADRVEGVDRWALKRAPKRRAVGEILRLARRLRSERFDAVVDLHAFYETGLLAWVTGAKTRIGPSRENRSLPFAYTTTTVEDRSKHVMDRYLAVAAAAGAKPRATEPRITVRHEDDEKAAELLEGLDGPIVGLNPGAGFEGRRWPAERFVALARELAADGARAIVFAGPEEPGLGHEIASRIGGDARGVERLTLGQLAAVMRRCALVVSNDTGPSHVAAATGAPTLVLMPGDAGPSPFSVRGERTRLIYGETILAIEVAEALAAARALLAIGER